MDEKKKKYNIEEEKITLASDQLLTYIGEIDEISNDELLKSFSNSANKGSSRKVEIYKHLESDLKPISSRVANFINDVISKSHPKIATAIETKFISNKGKLITAKKNETSYYDRHVKLRYAITQYSLSYLKRNLDHNLKKHFPQENANFLREFTKDQDLKWLTHDWDQAVEENEIEDYTNWINRCISKFNMLVQKYKNIPPETIKKIFLFSFERDFLKKERGWKDYWSFQRIKIGWSSLEVAKWISNNELPHNLKLDLEFKEMNELYHYADFKHVIAKFKREIQFRLEDFHLTKSLKFLARAFKWRAENKVRFDPSLKTVSFYCDTQKVLSGINAIMNPAIKRSTVEGITIRAEESIDNKFLIIIEHHKSYIVDGVIAEKIAESKIGGDFSYARDCFMSQCDWTFEGRTVDGNYKRFSYLGSNDNILPEFDGCRHILKFYKSTV